jgi:2-phosphosulfolactate phosphatase
VVRKTVIVDSLPDSARHYRDGYAIVAVDVIRATTTAVTAVAGGQRCFPVPSLEVGFPLAARLDNPLLVGELGGNMPYGFDLANSPAAIAARTDTRRPIILLSTSGTRLIDNAQNSDATYVACLRNHGATVKHLASHHDRVAVIGAGSRNEFRREDQLCCAWIAQGLVEAGFEVEDSRTTQLIERWRGASPEVIRDGNSARYLMQTDQVPDLLFVLDHINDLGIAVIVKHGELMVINVNEVPGVEPELPTVSLAPGCADVR